MQKIVLIPLLIALSACFASPTPPPAATAGIPVIRVAEDNPFASQPGDSNLRVAGLVLSSIDLAQRSDLDPPRVELNLLGSLPSVCDDLRVKITPPNAAYQVYVEVYGLINPARKCDDVFQQFEASILLGLYSPGTYTVWVNQGMIGNFVVY